MRLLCAASAVCAVLCPGGARADFGVSALPEGTNLCLEYDADTSCYYRIYSSTSIMGPWQMLEYQLGTQSLQSWIHSGVISDSDSRYYRLGRFQNGDFDGDGLADYFELIRARCDYQDPDSDGDQVLDGDEVHVYGSSPSSPFDGPTIFYTFDTNTQNWKADTGGVYGVASIGWTNAGYPRGGSLAVSPAAGSGYGDYYISDGWPFDDRNVVARPVYGLWIYVPTGAPASAVQVQLWVKSTSDGWLAHYGGFSTPLADQWNLITWDMASSNTPILADVDEWAVKLVWNNRSTWNGAVWIDSIHVVPAVQPTNLPPAITSLTLSTNNVPRYGKIEMTLSITNVQGLNPYDPDDVNLVATFVSPSSTNWTINGFYMEGQGDAYGHGTWKVRFAPNETGVWTSQVRVSTACGTNVLAGGTFTCSAGSQHGWIRVSDDDGHYLEHADDTAFYGIGYCRPYDLDDEGLFIDARDHGVNMVHYWMAPWDTLLTVEAVASNRESSAFYRYEQGRAAEIDRVIGYAEKYGVKLQFTIWTHDALRDFNYHTWRRNGSWQEAFDWKDNEPEKYVNAFSRIDSPSMNQKFFYDAKYKRYQENLYRYIISRWGYSEAIGCWNLASELYGTYANSLKCVRWQDPAYVTNKNALIGRDPYENMDTNQVDGSDHTLAWTAWIHGYFKTNDPYGHPTTASNETDEYWDDGFAVVDIPQIHAYSESYSWVTPPIMLAKYNRHVLDRFNKPLLVGETGSWKWYLYQPDFLRACMWPALCSGGAITPMMWTVPAFGEYCDPQMGPWLDDMADEAFLFSRFVRDIPFHHLYFMPAQVRAVDSTEPTPSVVESFEGSLNTNWHMFGTGIVSIALSTNYATHGTNSLRMNIDMATWDVTTNPASGVYNFTVDYNWSSYWPDGVLRVDLYIPEFYNPTNNPDGFLKGINRDPRCVVEIAAERQSDGQWNWYSTRTEYASEHNGWKKLTVGMLYNLEFRLEDIPNSYEAARIRGIKIWFGDAGILRGPVYIDNITAGRYCYNTWGLMSSNRDFAIAWIQDRQWTNSLNRNSTFQMNGLQPGKYNVEFWNSRRDDINSAQNFDAATGTLYMSDQYPPDFAKDIAMKIRRIGSTLATNHDVAVGCVSQCDWIVRSSNAKLNATVVNQGTATESFDVTLSDQTDGRGIATNRANNLSAGKSTVLGFTWNCTNASLGWHTLVVTAATVSGETDLSDNRLTAEMKIVAYTPPWDPCEWLRRWAPKTGATDAKTLVVSTNRASEGTTSFLLTYAAPTGYEAKAEMWFQNVFENWSGKSSLRVDVYRESGGASNVQLQMWTGTNWNWYYSWTKPLTVGWATNVTFTLNSTEWGNTNGWGVTPGNMDKVQQILFKFIDYTTAGSTYIDNIRLQ